MTELFQQQCQPRRGEHDRLPHSEAHRLLQQLPEWRLAEDGHSITRLYRFKDFLAAVAFVQRLADMAEAQDHHPDLEVGYGRCKVHFNTHDVGGLSLNDFICAAKSDQLFDPSTSA